MLTVIYLQRAAQGFAMEKGELKYMTHSDGKNELDLSQNSSHAAR